LTRSCHARGPGGSPATTTRPSRGLSAHPPSAASCPVRSCSCPALPRRSTSRAATYWYWYWYCTLHMLCVVCDAALRALPRGAAPPRGLPHLQRRAPANTVRGLRRFVKLPAPTDQLKPCEHLGHRRVGACLSSEHVSPPDAPPPGPSPQQATPAWPPACSACATRTPAPASRPRSSIPRWVETPMPGTALSAGGRVPQAVCRLATTRLLFRFGGRSACTRARALTPPPRRWAGACECQGRACGCAVTRPFVHCAATAARSPLTAARPPPPAARPAALWRASIPSRKRAP
jgi:hypothetical protein